MRMPSRRSHRVAVAGGLTALLVGGGTAAYAYWSTTGTGTGSSTTQASADTLTLAATFDASTLAPGKSVPVSFSATNAGTSVLRLANLSVTGITASGTCDPSWFTINGGATATVAENTTVPNGTTALPTGATLAFNDSGTNQDACKNATVTLSLTSN